MGPVLRSSLRLCWLMTTSLLILVLLLELEFRRGEGDEPARAVVRGLVEELRGLGTQHSIEMLVHRISRGRQSALRLRHRRCREVDALNDRVRRDPRLVVRPAVDVRRDADALAHP